MSIIIGRQLTCSSSTLTRTRRQGVEGSAAEDQVAGDPAPTWAASRCQLETQLESIVSLRNLCFRFEFAPRSSRNYIEYGGRQAHFQVFLIVSLIDVVCFRGRGTPKITRLGLARPGGVRQCEQSVGAASGYPPESHPAFPNGTDNLRQPLRSRSARLAPWHAAREATLCH